MSRYFEYYKRMKPLDLDAVGYVQLEDEEEPKEFTASVWVNDSWYDAEERSRTVISIEGYCGTTEFGFELDAKACMMLSDIIWSELFKRGVT